MAVLKKRSKLKDKAVYITDDLTPYRSGLAYQARKALKADKIADTWVYDGNIFIKKRKNDKAKRVLQATDIPQ